jgi:hypothetical protein
MVRICGVKRQTTMKSAFKSEIELDNCSIVLGVEK